MSRSYKKFPQFRDNLWGKSLKTGKQHNNRKIRRQIKNVDVDVGNGRDYKRFGYDSWDLWEYKSYQTEQDAIDEWTREQQGIANGVNYWKSKHSITLEEAIIDWKKFYKCK